jgi:hypothetical protein
MRKLTVLLGVMIIIGLLLTEAHSLLRVINPKLASTKVDLYIKKGFSYPITINWLIKFNLDSLYIIIVAFAGAKISYQYSHKLFLIFWVLFGYGCADLCLMWWDYKSSYATFWVIVLAASLCVVFLIFHIKTCKNKGNYFKSNIL